MVPPRVVLLALPLILAACSRKTGGDATPAPSPPPPPAAIGPVKSAAAPAASVPSAAASAGVPGAPEVPVPCWSASGYRGEVAGLPVFARLGLDGRKIRGRYFYERVGTDIALGGSLSGAGDVTLTEGPPGAPSGRFEGRCEEPTGVIAGTWSRGAKGPPTGTFRLVPIVAGDSPVTARRRVVLNGHGGSTDEDGGTTTWKCTYEETRFELFGLRDPRAERAINGQGLEPRLEPAIDKDAPKEVARCEQGFGNEEQRTVLETFRDIVTFQTESFSYYDGTPHPNRGVDFRSWDLRTGREITGKDVLARSPTAMLVACAEKQFPDGPAPNGGWEEMSEHFNLTAKGIHFFAMSFPHVFAAASGEGPTVSYAVLLRDGYLRKDSPLKRAWEGVEPAGRDEDPCGEPWALIEAP